MTGAIARLARDREYLIGILSRAGCHPCDRSEAGQQLDRLRRSGETLREKMRIYDGVC